jgi:hypothetical protein
MKLSVTQQPAAVAMGRSLTATDLLLCLVPISLFLSIVSFV